MIFEVVSTTSWSVLGTFEDADTTREAVRSALEQSGSNVREIVVYVSDEAGESVEEIGDHGLVEWAGISGGQPGSTLNPLAVAS